VGRKVSRIKYVRSCCGIIRGTLNKMVSVSPEDSKSRLAATVTTCFPYKWLLRIAPQSNSVQLRCHFSHYLFHTFIYALNSGGQWISDGQRDREEHYIVVFSFIPNNFKDLRGIHETDCLASSLLSGSTLLHITEKAATISNCHLFKTSFYLCSQESVYC
jgi:hypothetical protein